MLTVLHTESSMGMGGQEKRILRESLGMRQRGVRVLMACQPGSGLARQAEENGFEVRPCSMSRGLDVGAVLRLKRIVAQDQIDIINTHSGRDNMLAGLAGRLSSRCPRIIRTRHLALPISHTFSYSRLPHHVVSVSDYVRDYLISAGVPRHRVSSVPTGIDISLFNPDAQHPSLRQELGIAPDAPVIGTIAVLRKKKGHHHLLDAVPDILQRHPDAHFVWVGDGPQEDNLRQEIARRNLGGSVHMLGRRNDIAALLQGMDLFVLPTIEEALGTAFIEAMAMGKPVLGCQVGGVPEVIDEPDTGRLVPPSDPQALSAAIIDLLDQRQQLPAMGRAGRDRVLAHYTLDRMCDRMLEVYQAVLAKRR